MSLPPKQQRVLDQIEAALHAADPRLRSMFASFTRFTGQAEAPQPEAIASRLPRPAVLISLIAIGVITIALIVVPAVIRECPGLPSDQAVVPASVRLAACTHNTDAWSRGGR
jgi:hypothetical protein